MADFFLDVVAAVVAGIIVEIARRLMPRQIYGQLICLLGHPYIAKLTVPTRRKRIRNKVCVPGG